MLVYRITSSKYSSDISGTGAALFPGRWNKIGTPVLYTGESKEIALLEVLVHVQAGIVPELDILTIEIPDNSIHELKIKDLPAKWAEYPAPAILRERGEKWVREGVSLALKVPSSIISSSFILILNCRHKDYGKIKIRDKRKFHLDLRLIK